MRPIAPNLARIDRILTEIDEMNISKKLNDTIYLLGKTERKLGKLEGKLEGICNRLDALNNKAERIIDLKEFQLNKKLKNKVKR